MTWDELMAELKRYEDLALTEAERTGVRELYLLPEEFDALKRLCAQIEDQSRFTHDLVQHDPSMAFVGIPVIVETKEERKARLTRYVDEYIASLVQRIKDNDPRKHASSTVVSPEPEFKMADVEWMGYVTIDPLWTELGLAAKDYFLLPLIDWEWPEIERPDAAQLPKTVGEHTQYLSGRQGGKSRCPVHLVDEPCPTCSAYIAGGL